MRYLLILLLLVFIVSCKNGGEDSQAVEDRKELIQKIEASEKLLIDGSSKEIDDNNALKTIDLYKDFLKRYPGDDLASTILLKAGEVCKGRGDYQQAIFLLEKVRKNYPLSTEAPHALFLAAFTYDVHLNRKGKAKETYEEIVDKYPNHQLVKDSKEAIKLLSMSDEDLLNMIKSKNHN